MLDQLINDETMKWLTPALRQEVRDHFEPRYGRKLAEAEVEEIAVNLTDFVELYCKFRMNQKDTGKMKKKYEE